MTQHRFSVFWCFPEFALLTAILIILFLPWLNGYRVKILNDRGRYHKVFRIDFFTILFLFIGLMYFFVSFSMSWWLPKNTGFEIFHHRLVISSGLCTFKSIIFVLMAIAWRVSHTSVRQLSLDLQAGLGAMMGSTGFFLCCLISANDFFTLFFCLESASILLYVITGYNFGLYGSKESSLKYFILGSISTALMLYGVGLLLLFTNSVDFVLISNILGELGPNGQPYTFYIAFSLIFFSLFFKLSIFPCHFWTPDVYDRMSIGVLMFFSIIVKFAVFLAFFKINFIIFLALGHKLRFLISVGAAGSMLLGTLGALGQSRLHRFLAYTSINQMGFAMCCLVPGTWEGVIAFFFYFCYYILALTVVFIVLSCCRKNIDGQYKHMLFFSEFIVLGHCRPFGSLTMAFAFLSMGGIPPFGGFFGKFLLLRSLFLGGHYVLFFIVIFCSIISLFYYLRILRLIFFGPVSYENKSVGKTYVVANFFARICLFILSVLLFVIIPIFIDVFWDWFESLAKALAIFRPDIMNLL